MSDARPLRYCDVCFQLDDHPRHLTQVAGGAQPDPALLEGLVVDQSNMVAFLQLANSQLHVRHMDCCAAEGCEICQETEAANGKRRGQELIDHLNATRVTDG